MLKLLYWLVCVVISFLLKCKNQKKETRAEQLVTECITKEVDLEEKEMTSKQD